MVKVTVTYDGKVLVPEEPVSLPQGVPLEAAIETPDAEDSSAGLLALAGLGVEIWEGIDPIEYQHREREGWQ